MPFRPVHLDPDLGLVEVPCLQFFVPSRDLFLVLTCHCSCTVTVSLTCSRYHAAGIGRTLLFCSAYHAAGVEGTLLWELACHALSAVAALGFSELIYRWRSGFCYYGLVDLCMHLSIVLIHLHSQVVRVHREEILLSEREPVLLIRGEVICIL